MWLAQNYSFLRKICVRYSAISSCMLYWCLETTEYCIEIQRSTTGLIKFSIIFSNLKHWILGAILMKLRPSGRNKVRYTDQWDYIWMIKTKTKTENVWVSMMRLRLKMSESQWRERDWKVLSLNDETETETEKIWASEMRLGKRCRYWDSIETLAPH